VWPQCWLCAVCAVGRIGCCVGGEYPVGVSISPHRWTLTADLLKPGRLLPLLAPGSWLSWARWPICGIPGGAGGLGFYKILPIFYCNKGGRGGIILRNIVGNKGGLGGGYCTIICNNAPLLRVKNEVFFKHKHLDQSKIRPPKKKKKLIRTQTPQKHLKLGRGVQ